MQLQLKTIKQSNSCCFIDETELKKLGQEERERERGERLDTIIPETNLDSPQTIWNPAPPVTPKDASCECNRGQK